MINKIIWANGRVYMSTEMATDAICENAIIYDSWNGSCCLIKSQRIRLSSITGSALYTEETS